MQHTRKSRRSCRHGIRILGSSVIATLAVAAVAQANIMTGSLPTVTINGTNFTGSLSSATNFTFTGIEVSGGASGSGASGDYTYIPVGTFVGNNSTLSTSLTLGSTPGYSIDFIDSSGDYGTFTANSAQNIGNSGSGSSASASLYLLGTFTPGSYLLSLDSGLIATPSATSQIITVNQTNASTSSSSTLSSPPAPPTTVPEPGSFALLGTGLLGLGLAARRRRLKA